MKGFLKLLFTVVAGLLLAQSAFAQGTLRGKVTDQDGAPLPGVTVLVKGTTQGTMTGADGTYSMQASKGSVIEFSCLGLATQEHTFDGRTPINIQMTEDALYLDDVVVVGYGTAKKETLTAAVSAIKGDELLKAPATNVSLSSCGKGPDHSPRARP
ncbi:MAG: carboxypeptidase-like regulatory domain-containing protein [Bacteroidales bacterium]|nr:carboxypeptidase-like regulatory domain-containing protein [Bacteroidales bacterium]